MAADPSLDRIDRKILANLQAEGRLTNQALAERVALSPSACLARVKRLEQAGIIQGYHARLDPFRIDVGVVLFAEVTLKAHGAADLARLRTWPNGTGSPRSSRRATSEPTGSTRTCFCTSRRSSSDIR